MQIGGEKDKAGGPENANKRILRVYKEFVKMQKQQTLLNHWSGWMAQ